MAEYFKKDGENYVEVTDKLHTQSDVDSVVESRLERERKKFANYDDLKAKADKVDSISAEWETKLKAAGDEKSAIETQLGEAKLETVKVKAMHEFKLSDDLAEFINGTDEATVRTQAEKLSKGVGGASVKIDKSGKPVDDKKNTDIKKVTQSIFNRSSDS